MKDKQKRTTLQLCLCALFTALTAAGAFIRIPIPHMDYFTLQFFFVVLAGMLLGPRLGTAAVGTYVLLGLVGVPIFAAGGGIGYVVKPTFGYLLGFIGAAFAAGLVCKKKSGSYGRYLAAALAGFVVTYAVGLAYKYGVLNLYLGTPTPLWMVLLSGFPLDMPGDLALCALAAAAARALQKSKAGRDLLYSVN